MERGSDNASRVLGGWDKVEEAHRRLKSIQERYGLEMEQLVASRSLLTLRSLEILAGSVEQLHDQLFMSLVADLEPLAVLPRQPR